jgi:2,5-diamino-6-(ribosylamino)-4(3H)-pyrimidinone 5'-phosphate reductase
VAANTGRPRVICHMTTSVDGRIATDGWPGMAEIRAHYDGIHRRLDAQAWMCGRVTMEPFAGQLRDEAEVSRDRGGSKGRDDFRAPGDFRSFAFAVDPRGRLAWRSNDIDGDHVVAILSERVSDEYLQFLRQRGVSYMLAGETDVDLQLALGKTRSQFGVKTLVLEGGGRINGSMIRAGLIDELSLLIAPICDARVGNPALFDVDGPDVKPLGLLLESVEPLSGGVIWLRYSIGA